MTNTCFFCIFLMLPTTCLFLYFTVSPLFSPSFVSSHPLSLSLPPLWWLLLAVLLRIPCHSSHPIPLKVILRPVSSKQFVLFRMVEYFTYHNTFQLGGKYDILNHPRSWRELDILFCSCFNSTYGHIATASALSVST